MPEIPQPVANSTLEGVPPGNPIADAPENEELLKAELARLTPTNEELLALADKSPPPPEWLDEDEEPPF